MRTALVLLILSGLTACADQHQTPSGQPECACEPTCDPVKQACYCATDSGSVDYACEPGCAQLGCEDAALCDGAETVCWCYVPADGTAYACDPSY